MELKGKKVLVIGSGLSGIGSAHLLCESGALPVILDENEKVTVEAVKSKLDPDDRDKVEIIIGQLPNEIKKEIVLVVPSPAVSMETPVMAALIGDGIPVWSEIELAYNFAKGELIAITGTNGKTTTTSLMGEIMKAVNSEVYVVGNIGHSYALEALSMTDKAVSVAEISSFQLEAVDNFHAHISTILNITPDHLNRHHTMENYAACKENICNRQTKEDVCVLNYDNPYTREFADKCPGRVVFFSSQEQLSDGWWLKGDTIMLSAGAVDTPVMDIHDMNLVGTCNVENVMASLAMACAAGVPLSVSLRVIRSFKAVEHRIEYSGTKNGVDYYNDSKGTNPDAAIQGIKAMSKPTYLIGGGYDKGGDFDEWIEAFGDKVKELVLIGETADKIDACARKHGFTAIHHEDSFMGALEYCSSNAQPGDAVLLSPACASWDMFPSYEVRGRQFKEYVNGLK
ncbi:UDP-N-acetylmuramoyl-L-alanine--D-glutamate ligase [Butyrivibrio sp. MC2013]|uniref:UDP-N-acetylmuramoyl-L-alanine--D-glutamate ligase n=1 Tax=Butyrivibrio sp. MC2013 TaxID=1280686 RepID=UPI00040F9B92|nr:UDP-N-acetylmuramoyl-L-alanine--D-glutamate ligase [Butyrivibrio sp. MC2013]